MHRYAEMGFLSVWYDLIEAREILAAAPPRFRRAAERVMKKARTKGTQRTLEQLTEEVDGAHRFVEDVPLIVRETHLDDRTPIGVALNDMLRGYLQSIPDEKFPFANQGCRVVIGQRLTQGSPDIFLGWGPDKGRHYYVRQLADMKGGLELEEGDRKRLDAFPAYCRLCGWALALAHAKSGDPP